MKITKNQKKQGATGYLPMSPLRNIFDEFWRMSSLMDDVFGNKLSNQTVGNITADIWEEDDKFYVKLAIPGVKKEDINLEIDENYIRVKAGKSTEEESKEGRTYYYKSIETYYEEVFQMPETVDPEKTEAEYENGVLLIKLPKAESTKPKKITIK